MKIGFFDSGLGGLTLLRSTTILLPQYDYLYYGDTKNIPYGNRTEAEIYELTKAGIESLFADGCLLIIIACNTSSAQTLRRLQDTFLQKKYPERKVLGVIVPTIEAVLEKDTSHPLLIATRLTVESKKYEIEFSKRNKNPKLTSIATPELVDYIEKGNLSKACMIASGVIDQSIKRQEIDSCILGCTHYTVLAERLRKKFPTIHFFSQDEIISYKLKNYLTAHPEIEQQLTQNKERTIRLTDNSRNYDDLLVQMLE